jgi:hypothetical protein
MSFDFAIDVPTRTVILNDQNSIRHVMGLLNTKPGEASFKLFNTIATVLAKKYADEVGLDKDNLPDETKWSLGATNRIDNQLLISYLNTTERLRAESVDFVHTKET